ncbi:LCP family protein [Actinomadura sp. DC4]|uniref:LCP family protein n=1 Tax=Actinomadura sp. DC4 TaxID=3055069 RepID=UPI0025B0D48E|nr:LCP family protein [Actinomadura sp. DC4]MDN3357985.1 LCP family protein [Actinomadura sp. DC4]
MADNDADDAAKPPGDEDAEPTPQDAGPASSDAEPEKEPAEDEPDDAEAEKTEEAEETEKTEAAKPVRKRHRVLRWAAAIVAVVVLAAGGTAGYLYVHLNGNIHKENVEQQLGPDRPAKLNKSMNILLLGSDSRDGDNKAYWSPDISGERSDTTILLHLSPNRDRVVAVSFPRDSMVQVPQCEKKNGQKVAPFFGMLNAAFAYAGASCTWKTIESTTDIHIDHYVKIDFTGFKRVVDALGGVEICVPHAVNDPRANLSLRAGRQVVKGNDALGYVRTRYGIGDGSDLERIQRQQKFMASVVNKATSSSMLTDPTRIYTFLDAVTKSIATDDKLSVSAMRKLATSMKGISAGTVRFVTVPTQVYPRDPNRVQWDMAQAKPLFDAIRGDDALPAPKPAPPVAEQPKPEDVKVRVVNGPKKAVKALKDRHFKVTTAKGPVQTETKILYGPGGERQADAVGVAVPGVRILPDPTVPPGTVSLVVAPAGVQVTPVIPKVTGEIKADQVPC